ncbi:MAG TPA: Rieske (2Fe-2S) protein [bacterium]|jgi:nitrite reductase/ring-hydroxylating ferredoxin subunit|nr:Rieske (2Fe-2S) protein [bacterium]
MGWQAALPAEALAVGGRQKLELGGQPVLVARLAQGYFAVHDTCLHRGGSLSVLPLEDGEAVCHLHGWRFRVEDGVCTQVPSLKLRSFPVRVEDGTVYVEI